MIRTLTFAISLAIAAPTVAFADAVVEAPAPTREELAAQAAQAEFDRRLISRWGEVTNVELSTPCRSAPRATAHIISCSGDYVAHMTMDDGEWRVDQLVPAPTQPTT